MPATTFDRSPRALTLPQVPTLNLTLRLPRWLPGLGLAVLAVGLLVLALQWHQPVVSRLQVEGRFEHVNPEAVRQAASAHLSQGFFSVDIEAIRLDVARLPWVDHSRVERVWPNQVRIRIWERQAFARWNDGSLLDTSAVAFTPDAADLQAHAIRALPSLQGTPGNEKLVSDTYKSLSQALDPTTLALTGLQMDARGEWTVQTARGIELRLGPGVAAEKLPVLLGALPEALGERLSDVAYVDLRYTNGFAIGWVPKMVAPAGIHGTPSGSSGRDGVKHG